MKHKEDMKQVKRLLSGDERAFDLFYNTFFPRLYRFCRFRMSSESSCEDIVQQALSNALRHLHTYRGEASLFSWLCQIARNEIYAWHKKYGKNTEKTSSLDDNPVLLSVIESIPTDLYGAHISGDDGVKELVQMSLDMLPNAYGSALELKYIEGLSVAEIANRFDTTETAIQSLLARARRAFKDIFSEMEQAYKPTLPGGA